MDKKKEHPTAGEGFVMTPLSNSKSVNKKVIYLKQRTRSSSESSCSDDEQVNPILPTKVEPDPTTSAGGQRRVTGRCLCKLSIVFYLLGCVVISTLYVIFYGNKQQLFGEAWIPGKVGGATCTCTMYCCPVRVHVRVVKGT